MSTKIDITDIRSRFPAIDAVDDVFMDNAGGSQVPAAVIERVRDYMANSYVQLGADYATGRRADAVVDGARDIVGTLLGAGDDGVVVLGPSTSSLCNTLADCYARSPHATRDEIIVAESAHEANFGPWWRLGERGYSVKTWQLDPARQACPIEALEKLLGERTRIVALPHVSNLLGAIDDVPRITRLAHDAGARVVVDGVAFAPHRALDVAAWGVDYYVFSIYKVYGPHMAALYGTRQAMADIVGPNHFFVDDGDVPYKMELGGVLHEGCAGILGVADYLRFLAGAAGGEGLSRADVVSAFAIMEELELPLQKQLLDYLNGKPEVRVIGPKSTGPERVPTVSFAHAKKSSREIAVAANDRGFGIRYGHFYAHRLATALGLEPDDGVVRVSLLHYNTADEVARLTACLDQII